MEEPEPAGPIFPTVRAIVYDQIHPSVRLADGEHVSGWLRQGDSFRGWTITQITAQSVRIQKDGATYQIRAY